MKGRYFSMALMGRKIAAIRAYVVEGGGADYHDQSAEHWIVKQIATPMSIYPEYKATRTSFGINALKTLVVEVEADNGVTGFGITTGGYPAAWLVMNHLDRFVVGKDANKIVICCGGGGIPVTLQGDHLKGASAVIDKDFASCLLAKELDADMLIILTAVEKVAVNFGKENEKWLDEMTVEEAQKYVEEGQFAPGSMLPKVQAAMDFASSGEGRTAMITLLEKAKDGIQGKTGTKVHI